jgi:hypothetical protein
MFRFFDGAEIRYSIAVQPVRAWLVEWMHHHDSSDRAWSERVVLNTAAIFLPFLIFSTFVFIKLLSKL